MAERVPLIVLAVVTFLWATVAVQVCRHPQAGDHTHHRHPTPTVEIVNGR